VPQDLVKLQPYGLSNMSHFDTEGSQMCFLSIDLRSFAALQVTRPRQQVILNCQTYGHDGGTQVTHFPALRLVGTNSSAHRVLPVAFFVAWRP
jgi:hypothetical protein